MSQSDLREQLTNMTETFERIGQDAMAPAIVIGVHAKTMKVATSDSRFVIGKPTDVSIKVGDSILIHHQQKAYIRHNEFPDQGERVATVTEVLGDCAVLEHNGERRLVPFGVAEDVKPGDKIVMDASSSMILRVIKGATEDTAPPTNVTWDDIGGNDEAKLALIEAIENPVKEAELMAFYGAKAPNGILLSGPPGCGKTMLGKAAATALGSAEGFIYCSGPEVLDPYVGVAEAKIRSMFQRARSYKERTGNKAVIFLDEAEAILGNRDGFNGQRAHMEKTIVPMFLTEMDGLLESAATVILSTNKPLALDPAVVRDGRCDRKVHVHRPTQKDSVAIMLTHLRHAPTNEDRETMAASVVENIFMETFINGGQQHLLSNYVSGSLIAGIVAKAKEYAMRRDKAEKTRTGITFADMDSGVAEIVKEMSTTALEQAN